MGIDMGYFGFGIAGLVFLVVLLTGIRIYIKKRLRKMEVRFEALLAGGGFESEVNFTRSRIDVDPALPLQFAVDSLSAEFLEVYDKPEPLVSICVGTYNRGELLVERCVSSLLAQTYQNIEIIVVGDCCTDDTEARMAAVHDPRVRFVNLAQQGDYPPDGPNRWMVAGSATMNKALELAEGDFVCHLDDDDEFMPDKVEKLVRFIQQQRTHFVWHPFEYQLGDYTWQANPALELELGKVTTSAIFYHRWLKRIPWDVEAWRFGEPGDWNRVRRLKYIGMQYQRYDEVLIKHYRENSQ